MAGQQELIIKLIILTVILVTIGVGGYFGYKYFQEECPGGLFVCMGIDDDPSAAAGPGPGAAAAAVGPGPGAGTPSGNQSGDYTECTRHFSKEDKTKTCYDPGAGKGGIRWFWADTAGGKSCLEKTKFYKIEASTAANEHKLTYEYIKPGGLTNGFIFQNAKNVTQKDGIDMNMRFNITPLDKDKKVLADPLMGKELNPGGGVTKDCTAVGVTPKDFHSVFGVQSVTAYKPPPPQNCQGTMSDYGPCIPNNLNPVCNVSHGKSKRTFNAKQDSKHGGVPCPGTEYTQCVVTTGCTPKEGVDLTKLPACSFGDWITPADQPGCPSECTSDVSEEGRWGPMVKQEKFVSNVILDGGGKLTCSVNEPTTRVVRACKTKNNAQPRPLCPVKCEAVWSPTVETGGTMCFAKPYPSAPGTKKYKVKTFTNTWVVSKGAENGGTCAYPNGTTKTTHTHHGYTGNGCGRGGGGVCKGTKYNATCDTNFPIFPVYT